MRTITMKAIWRFGASLGIVVLALLLSVAPASGIQLSSGAWEEDGDAPDGVAGAPQDTTGSGPLTGISGNLGEPLDPADVVDMFRIRASSSASEITVTDSGFNSADFLVFLFDTSGAGLGAAYFGVSPTDKVLTVPVSAGLEYLLAVSLLDYIPLDSADNPLFDSSGAPISGSDVLAAWVDDAGSTIFDPPFSFTLEGADPFRLSQQVPEPATLSLLGAGLAGMSAAAWRRRRQ